MSGGTAGSTPSASTDSPLSYEHYPWPTASSDSDTHTAYHNRPAHSAAAYSNLTFQHHDAAQPVYSRASQQYEQTWFTLDADLLDSSFHARSSLSPLPLTSVVNSLYLQPYITESLASHHSDESDSTNSPTSLASSPPPLPPSSASEPVTSALYAFPAPPLPPPPPSTVPPSAPPTSRKRGKADDGERAARAERKRHRHRAIDLARRQRETSAVQRLNQLIATVDRRSTDAAADDFTNSDERRDKVSVLEQAVQQLAGLQQLVAQLTHQNNSQHDQLHAVRFQLRQTQNTLTTLDDETRSHSIYSSAFLSSTLSLFLVSVSTGLVLDANARLFQSTGWQRHHVIGRLLTAPYKILLHRTASDSERQQNQQKRLLIEDAQKHMVPARNVQQYESARQAVVDVSTGVREQVHSAWRLYVRDGRLCEAPGTCWGGESEEVEEGEGDEMRRYRRPKHIIFAFSFSEVLMVD